MKWLTLILAFLAILSGTITFWLPLPIGLPLLMVGVALLMRTSPRARLWLLHLSRHSPKFHRFLQRLGSEKAH